MNVRAEFSNRAVDILINEGDEANIQTDQQIARGYFEHPDLPPGGSTGDLLAKKSNGDFEVEWVTPASHAEADNTRPITAAAVYTEIGNINALLAII